MAKATKNVPPEYSPEEYATITKKDFKPKHYITITPELDEEAKEILEHLDEYDMSEERKADAKKIISKLTL